MWWDVTRLKVRWRLCPTSGDLDVMGAEMVKQFFMAASLFLFAAQFVHAQIVLVEGYVRGMPPGQAVTAAFMTLRNTGEGEVVLTSASSPVADKLEFHQHSHEGGMMRMRRIDELRVPAGGELQLAPGHLHLMLIDLLQPLNEGDSVPIELCSDSGTCQSINLKVISVLNEP